MASYAGPAGELGFDGDVLSVTTRRGRKGTCRPSELRGVSFVGVPPGTGAFVYGASMALLAGSLLVFAGVALLAIGVGALLLLLGVLCLLAAPYVGWRTRKRGHARLVIAPRQGYPFWLNARGWDPSLLAFAESLAPALGSRLSVTVGHRLPRRGRAREGTLQALIDEKLRFQFPVRHELGRLPGELRPEERVLNLARGKLGSRWGLLVATDQRLLFLESGLIRHAVAEFPYRSVTAVGRSAGAAQGEVSLLVSGGRARITRVFPVERAAEISELVGARIAPPSSPPASATVETRLVQLGQLRAQGLITEDEYASKRQQLLREL